MKDHTPKPTWTFVVFAFALLFARLSSAVDVWSFPNETELKTLVVTNLKSQPKDLWISGPNLQDETRLTVPAYGHLEIPLTDFSQHPWLRAVSTEPHALHLEIQTSFETMLDLEPEQTTTWKVRAVTAGEIILFNQAPFAQKIEIRTPTLIWKEVTLAAFEKIHIPIAPELKSHVLSINGEARFSGISLAGENSQRLVANPKPQILAIGESPARYFRLTNSSQDQSYVVKLDSAELIAEAQNQIQRPWQTTYLPRILMARVEGGHGGFNRDMSSPWKAPWSWHVAEVFRFADFASQACDGSPEFLEQTLQSWSPDGQGVICFWNYRITEELSADQVQNGRTPSH
jgi:hypothetical protein